MCFKTFFSYRMIKRVIDLVLSLVLILLFSPIFVIIFILIKLTSKGSVFHKTERLGKNNSRFIKYKFRTMVPNGEEILKKILKENHKLKEEYTNNYKIKNDPRVTKIGKLLRKYSLDELPQFINVLKGDMSLVGPRDILEQELNDHYSHCKDKLLSVKPGITGLWQVSGRSKLTYEERVKLDMLYIENRSLWFDFKIILKTPLVMMQGDGAL